MPVKIYWSADQFQGERQYQEDVYAIIDSDYVWMPGQRLDLSEMALADNISVYLLADGMGGMGHGDYAAKLAVQTVVDHLIANWSETLSLNELSQALVLANEAIHAAVTSNTLYAGMGCTFIAVVVDSASGRMDWVSIGDSPLLLNKGVETKMLNTKHIWENWAEVTGNLPGEKEADLVANHGEALFAAVDGALPLLHVQSSSGQDVLDDGDILVIASDGVEVIDSECLLDVMSSATLRFRNSNCGDTVEDALCAVQKSILTRVEQLGLSHQDNTSVILVGARQAN